MKVLWITNLPSPYRVKFFNELGKKCDLLVLAERQSSSERDASWSNINNDSFRLQVLRGIKTGPSTAFCPSVVKYIKRDFDIVVVTNISTPTGILALRMLRIKKIPFYIESDGGIPKSGKGIKEAFKKSNLKGAKAYFSTAYLNDEYFIKYGVSKDKLIRYPFTSVDENDILDSQISIQEKLKIRSELNMHEDKILIAVGQFIKRKGFDVLIKACEFLDDSFGIYIIGGQAPTEYIEAVKKAKLNNIHFIGFKEKTELSKYYCASDIFVHPTREDIWGLVINEAMAKGLPIITTEKCIAGLELVKNGINGYIVPIENPRSLADAIVKASDNALAMGKVSLELIHDYSIEKMAERHLFFFKNEVNT